MLVGPFCRDKKEVNDVGDDHRARKMGRCPRNECDGSDCSRGTYKFECDECSMMFP